MLLLDDLHFGLALVWIVSLSRVELGYEYAPSAGSDP